MSSSKSVHVLPLVNRRVRDGVSNIADPDEMYQSCFNVVKVIMTALVVSSFVMSVIALTKLKQPECGNIASFSYVVRNTDPSVEYIQPNRGEIGAYIRELRDPSGHSHQGHISFDSSVMKVVGSSKVFFYEHIVLVDGAGDSISAVASYHDSGVMGGAITSVPHMDYLASIADGKFKDATTVSIKFNADSSRQVSVSRKC